VARQLWASGSQHRTAAGNRHRSHPNEENGFTLIEIMIAVAIVAILAILAMSALPSYNNYSAKVNRIAATQFMMVLAYHQEQYLLDHHSYAAINCTTTCTGSLSVRPDTAVATHYTVSAVLTGNDCIGNPVTDPSLRHHSHRDRSQVKDGNLCLDSLSNKIPAAKWDS
jgi:type IV pilus assembly protein PilE